MTLPLSLRLKEGEVLEGRPHMCLPAPRLLGLPSRRIPLHRLGSLLLLAHSNTAGKEKNRRESILTHSIQSNSLLSRFHRLSFPERSSPFGLHAAISDAKLAPEFRIFFGGSTIRISPSVVLLAGRPARWTADGHAREEEASALSPPSPPAGISLMFARERCDGRMGEGIAVRVRRVGEYRGLRNERALFP